MKRIFKYTLVLLLGLLYNYCTGQLNLSTSLAPGQYYDPSLVHAESGTRANVIGTQLIHLSINSSLFHTSPTYVSQLPPNILTNEANTDEVFPNTSLPVGKTPYSYGVSPSGGATYSVPIIIPPGTMGMAPNLAVVYNSQSVNGLLGYGWNLSGLSYISRMGKTPYHNFGAKYPDQTQAVTLTDTDWFALDGNRLVATSGLNGRNGTTYATESETFSQIKSYLRVGNGPDWFTVQTKNGLTIEYGHDLDARLVPFGQSTVFAWYIDRITDQFGNYMSFYYYNNNGEVRIKEIDYTGNISGVFVPYNSVVFNYETRTDANTTYVAGGALNTSAILDSIAIYSHGVLFKKYSFKYVYNLYTMLQEIDEMGSDHTTLNPLQFSYGSDVPVVGSSCGSGPKAHSNYSIVADPYELGGIGDGITGFNKAAQFTLLDYNGDGKTDVISLIGTYEQLSGEGEGPPVPLNEYGLNWSNQTLYRSAAACPYFDTVGYSFPEGYPTSNSSATSYSNPVSNNGPNSLSQFAGDFNGDGKDDYAVSTFSAADSEGADIEEHINIALSTGRSFATSHYLKAYDMYNNSTELGEMGAPTGTTLSGTFYLDLNGDGQIDVFNYHFDPVYNKEYYRVWLNAGASNTTPQEQHSTTYTLTPSIPTSPNFEVTVNDLAYLDFSNAIPMDLNGDGKTELVNVFERGFGSPYRVIVSFNATQVYGQPNYLPEADYGSYPGIPGNGIVIQPDSSGFSYNINNYVASDSTYETYNYTYNPEDESYDYYFPRDTFGYDNVYGITTNINNNGSPYVLYADFNGDGITDVLSYDSVAHAWTMNYGKGGGNYASIPVSTLSSDDPFSYPNHYYYAQDVNGDGKADVLEFIPQYGGSDNTLIKTYYSTGKAFIQGDTILLKNHDINPQTWQIAFGDFNGDGVSDLLLEPQIGDGASDGSPLLIYFYSGSNSRQMAEAVDGYNESVQFTYQPLTNSSIYTQPNASNYRSVSDTSKLLDIQVPMYVVSRLTTLDGTGNHTTTSISKDGISNYITYVDTSSTTYTYQDAIYSKLGLGILGFLNVTSYNSLTDYSSSMTYTVSPAFDNMVPSTSSITKVGSATIISDNAYTFNPIALGGLRYFIADTQSVANDDIAGVTDTTRYTYRCSSCGSVDNYGNLAEKTTKISVAGSSTAKEFSDVKTTYTTSATWIPAVVGTMTSTITYLAKPSYTRTSSNAWDAYGHLTSTTTDPSTSEAVTTSNTYDSHSGALLQQTTTSADATCLSETNSWTYDSYSQFKVSSTNPLGQTTKYRYNPMWGKIARDSTPDGLLTTFTYDAWGRSAQINTPDGLTQTLTYQWVTPGELPEGGTDPFTIVPTSLYSVTSIKRGYPFMRTFYDWFDRKTSVETSTMNAIVYKEQAYDALGHDYQSTGTYQKTIISGTYGHYNPVTITKLYDDIEYRLTSVSSTCDSAPTLTTTFTYTTSAGNSTVKTTKSDTTVSSQTTNFAGLLINSTDYVFGYPSTAYSSIDYTYLSNGRSDSVILNGNTVDTFQYDAYGRQIYLYDVNFTNPYRYHYNAYNQLVGDKNPNGNTDTVIYDLAGRISSKVNSLDGTYSYSYFSSGNGLDQLQSQQKGSNTISYTYDYLHRPLTVDVNSLTTTYTYGKYNHDSTKTYPSGFITTNKYDTNGYITETDTAGFAIWTAEYMNPEGQYVDYLLGNGVHTIKSYNPYGYLNGISGGSYENMSFNFAPANGNLISRTEGGLSESFTYDASLHSRLEEAKSTYSMTTTADITMNYDLDGNIQNKSDICAPSTNYSDNGSNNQIEIVPNSSSLISPGQAVTYTSFNAPSTISLNSYSMVFTYGPDNNREETVLTDPWSNTTTMYFANDYEKTIDSASNITQVNYIQCGGDLVAMEVKQGHLDTMNYVYTDHLGSILTVANSKATYNQSFDAWGNYRNPTNGSYTSLPVNPVWMYRGYTGHEHLPKFQLINMNGRLYDPLINSMLSPDITVQSPTNTQNYNRYSYCLNNPLKYTDPSGFQYNMTPYVAAIEAQNAHMQDYLNQLDEEWNAYLNGADGVGVSNSYCTIGAPGPGGGSNGGGGGGVSASGGGTDDNGNSFLAGSSSLAAAMNYVEGRINEDEANENDAWNAAHSTSGNTSTSANSSLLTMPSLFGTSGAANTKQQIATILGANIMNIRQASDPTAQLSDPGGNGIDFSNAGAEMANMPSGLFIDNAYQYKGVPYLFGGFSTGGIDCSGLVDKSIGFSTHLVWNTSGGAPPGFQQVYPSTNSPENFAQGLQYGDVLVWPGEHTVFVSGFGDDGLPQFFEAHGPQGSATGFTNFYNRYVTNMGYPNAYQQLPDGQW